MPHAPVRVAVVGATGYSGQELLRWLPRHPGTLVTGAYGSSASEGPRRLPALARIWDGEVVPLDRERLVAENDAVLLALPEKAAAETAPALVDAGLRIIDLSGAFRLKDERERARWYPASTTLPAGTVYGLAERDAEAIRGARLISCPGCYPTAALLALAPLADAGLLEGDVVIDAKSGISGAGKTPSDRTHFSENHGSVAAYGIFTHRHAAEIEQELGHGVTFVPHLVPLDRGILETIYVHVPRGTTASTVAATFEAAYASAPFVRITGGRLPEIKHVANTNFCDIGWAFDAHTGRLVIVACLDNLVKGAAGQAIQNLNVAFGLDERAGLL